MSLDRRIKEAIREAVEEEHQPESVSALLISWMEEVASGREDIQDDNQAVGRLELIYDQVSLDDDGTERAV
ncbi:CxC ATPase DNA modification system associated small protein [Sphaerisporangium sp. NPDC049003]|uniref:CxC ATPase DNA modification system associated small protein n=1 Tax=Sphaerisporangium sp. NPDC049003 TaxID=3364517 RepID=UPI00371FBF19